MTEATLQRRKKLHKHFEELVGQIDTDGNGLLDSEEMKDALSNDPEFQERVQMMAFNLALDPENRLVSDNPELNIEIQNGVEEFIRLADVDGDGFITREEIQKMPVKERRSLSRIGLPPVLGHYAGIV